MDEREGKPIYVEGKIEVRTHEMDPEAHNVWIGDNYFLFQRGCIEQFAERTPTINLRSSLRNYNFHVLHALDIEKVSLEHFALVLSKALEKEREDLARFMIEE